MPWIKDKVTGERKWFPSGGVSRETVQKMIDDAGGVSDDEVKTAVEEALTQAKESGDFKGDKGDPGYTPQKGVDYFDGAKGDPGDDYILTEADKTEIAETAADIVDDALSEVIGDPDGAVPAVPGYMALGMTGAAVGQVARIAAVDADGKPSAWEPVEMANGGSGGGDGFVTLADETLDEAVASMTFNFGKPYRVLDIYVYTPVAKGNTTNNNNLSWAPNGNAAYVTTIGMLSLYGGAIGHSMINCFPEALIREGIGAENFSSEIKKATIFVDGIETFVVTPKTSGENDLIPVGAHFIIKGREQI